MGKGYAEGPAAEEAERRREELADTLAEGATTPETVTRLAVVGCTRERPDQHVLGWADEVDVETLFASGRAWGIRTERRPVA